jgi:predicted nucleotidyltransferase
MLTKSEVIQKLQESLPGLREAYGVKRIGLFGSIARDEQRPDSDVDLVIEFERPIGLQFVELSENLERILGSKVDLLTPAGVKSIRNPMIAARILESVTYV